MTLDELEDGQSCVVVALRHEAGAAARLMEMGFLQGARLRVLRRAPLGDPLEIEVGDSRLGLRKSEAALVDVAC